MSLPKYTTETISYKYEELESLVKEIKIYEGIGGTFISTAFATLLTPLSTVVQLMVGGLAWGTIMVFIADSIRNDDNVIEGMLRHATEGDTLVIDVTFKRGAYYPDGTAPYRIYDMELVKVIAD